VAGRPEVTPPPKRTPPPLPAAARRPQDVSPTDDRPQRPRPARRPSPAPGQGLLFAGVAAGLFLLLACILTGVGYLLWPKPSKQPGPVASAPPPADDGRRAGIAPPVIEPALAGPPALAELPPWRDVPPVAGQPAGKGLAAALPPAEPPKHPDERIRNGDFEQGAKGFRTAYTYSTTSPLDAFSWCVVENPHDVHTSAAAFGDHTTGRGRMLMVNGGDAPDAVVWGQEVEVRAGAAYSFRLWVASWYDLAPAELVVRINGESVGRVTAPSRTGEWKELQAKWKAGKDRKATIEIFNLTHGFSGNDFAIDDISLRGPAP
jgi:hypothetical protein